MSAACKIEVRIIERAEREVLVERVIGGRRAVVMLAHVDLEPALDQWRDEDAAPYWNLVLPMDAAKECGLVE